MEDVEKERKLMFKLEELIDQGILSGLKMQYTDKLG